VKYIVSIPITGVVAFEVEASGTVAAIKAAWEAVDAGKEGDVTWEYCDQVCEGNMFRGMQNEVGATRVSEPSPSPREEPKQTGVRSEKT
jgi:hypothetical protein